MAQKNRDDRGLRPFTPKRRGHYNMEMKLLLFFLFLATPVFANQQAIKSTLGEASVNTPYSRCAAGDNSNGKTKGSKNVDTCSEAGIPAGVCAACAGNPSDTSDTCRNAIARYKELGLY